MTNSVDPDQTAPTGAVCSVSTLFASILKFFTNVWHFFAADDFSRRHFQMHFSWRFKGLNVDKKICGARREKNSLQGFENNKGADQSALPQ